MTDRGLNLTISQNQESKEAFCASISDAKGGERSLPKREDEGWVGTAFRRIGYCFTGSYCTLERSFKAMERLIALGASITPIMSENVYFTDTRFAKAEEFSRRVESLCGRSIIHTVTEAERLGPAEPQDLLIVAPCTGNTMAKVANGITDTAATMAIKAHLRQDRPLLIGLSTNDALSQNLSNLGRLLCRRSVYLLPMKQDSPVGKPHSLVAEFEMMEEAVYALSRGQQLRPLFLT